jgi:hypothetical protein
VVALISAVRNPIDPPLKIREIEAAVSDYAAARLLSARNLLILGVRVSFAWKEPACSFSCGRKFSGEYVRVGPAIELIGEIQVHAL